MRLQITQAHKQEIFYAQAHKQETSNAQAQLQETSNAQAHKQETYNQTDLHRKLFPSFCMRVYCLSLLYCSSN